MFLTLSEDSISENCNRSSTAHEDAKFDCCCAGIFIEVWGALLWGGSNPFFSVFLLQLELKATRIPVARNLWWFAERLPAEWIGSSQSRQKRALSSTQKMKAVFSCISFKSEKRIRTSDHSVIFSIMITKQRLNNHRNPRTKS